MPSPQELQRAITGLVRAGVTVEDANRILDVVARSERNVLALVALRGVPRPGHRVRRVTPSGAVEAMIVIDAVRCEDGAANIAMGLGRWAVAGEPVRPGARDDVLVLPRSLDRIVNTSRVR